MPAVKHPILEGLNPEQSQAVTYGEGPLLIVAGAGTGKTSVLTKRIAWLIAERKIAPDKILALTFSEKAAAEMEARVDPMVPYGYAPLSLSTFHAFGARILREHAYRLGLNPEAEILSGAPLRLFLKKHLFELPLKRFRPLGNPEKNIADLIQLFQRAKDEAIGPEAYLAAAEALAKEAQDDAAREEAEEQVELAAAYEAYDLILHREGFLDHGDQLFLPLRLLQEHPAALESLRAQHPWILVDEFQDTNTVQFLLLKLLAAPELSANLTVVGDDDQAIYRFRGASIANILDFKASYPKAASVVLTRNYRSHQDILDCAHRSIQFNNPHRLESQEGFDKRLIAERKMEKPQAVFLKSFEQLSAELSSIADYIEAEKSAGRRSYQDFAVLFRTRRPAEALIQELNHRAIPTRFTGARNLYRQPEIRLCLAFLRALAQPHNDLALFEHLVGEICRVPVSDLKELLQRSRHLNKSLYQILTRTDLTRAGEDTELDPEARERVDQAILTLSRFEAMARQQGLGPSLFQYLKESGYVSQLISNAAGPDVGAERQVANLARFFEKIKEYDRVEKAGNYISVVDYLDALIEEGEDPISAEAEIESDAVTISTVHASKGLEWAVVFLPGLESGHFPSTNKGGGLTLPAKLFPEPENRSVLHMEEERRLFYVAMTRARDELYLSHAYDHGKQRSWKRSPFLQETLNLGKEQAPAKRLSPVEKLSRHAASEAHPLLSRSERAKPGEVLRLTYYPIDDYLTCPLKYKISHILGLEPPVSGAMTYGKVMHQVVQEFNRARMEGRELGRSELQEILRKRWRSEGYISAEHEAKRLEHGLESIARFYEQEISGQRVPIEVESPFEFRLGPLEVMSGRMDRVDRDAQGEVTICDYKTSNVYDQAKAEKEIVKNLQLAVYALAYEAREGRLPDWLELHFLESGLTERLKPDAAFLTKKKEEILTAFDGIRRANFEATPSFNDCKYCAYASLCPVAAVE